MSSSLEKLVDVNLAEEGILRLLFVAAYLMFDKIRNDNEVSAASRYQAFLYLLWYISKGDVKWIDFKIFVPDLCFVFLFSYVKIIEQAFGISDLLCDQNDTEVWVVAA